MEHTSTAGMAGEAPDTQFHSIADAAAASWYAHRAATPASKPSSSVRHDDSQRQASVSASVSASASTSTSIAAAALAVSIASASPAPSLSVPPPMVTEASASGASSTPTPSSSRRDSEVQVSGDPGIHSDISAWQSALQSLPPEFASATLPSHPLSQALAGQPTLRPVEWNLYRQQGGFVPRTAHDYSSLMIYISGQMNPNPCRNCLLRNGPFARCVVSPPAVLAISTLRHACANCTYQNQYKKCTNEPISEQERVRSDLARPVIRGKNPITRPMIPRKPVTNSRSERRRERVVQLQQRLQGRQRKKRQQEERQDAPAAPSLAGLALGLDASLESFDEKLRHIRACSPHSRRRMAAETLQWQAAIATVEAEGLTSAPAITAQGPSRKAPRSNHARAPINNNTSSQRTPTSSTTLAVPAAQDGSFGREGDTGHGAEPGYEPMDEDESDSEQEDAYEGVSPWVAANRTEAMIKAPR